MFPFETTVVVLQKDVNMKSFYPENNCNCIPLYTKFSAYFKEKAIHLTLQNITMTFYQLIISIIQPNYISNLLSVPFSSFALHFLARIMFSSKIYLYRNHLISRCHFLSLRIACNTRTYKPTKDFSTVSCALN